MGDTQKREKRDPGPIWRVIRVAGIGVLVPVLILKAAIIGFFNLAAASPEEPDADCFARPFVDVRVGKQLFEILRIYSPGFNADHIPSADSRICQRPGDQPIVANGFWIDTTWWSRTGSELDPGFRAQVSVSEISRPLGYRSEKFSIAQRSLREKGIPMEAAEKQHGFLAPKPVGKGTRFFIASAETFHTPRGLPLTFACHPTPTSTLTGTDLGHRCETHYALSENIGIRYVFYDARHPIEGWGELDASIRDFVRRLQKGDP